MVSGRLPMQEVSNILWAACGVNREDGRLTVPTAMNRQLIAVYAVLPDGVYRYDAAKNALEQVLAGDYLKLYANGAPLVLLHAAKESDRYSPFHVGSMYENVALYCASAGLANVMKAQETNRLDGSLPLPEGWKVYERVRPEMMTCKEVVATGRYPYTGKFGVLSKEDWKIVDEAVRLVHIEDLAERDFTKTSDGQKQRVMLARALCQQPDILVLDEPTSFLDIRYKLEFLSIIQEMARNDRLTVILSLHELDLAERISDKVLCVRGDRIDRFGTPEEIFCGDYISELYGMTAGHYDAGTGELELQPVSGVPKVFVIAGGGRGKAVFRRLQRQGMPFATGILWENDLDYPSAKALAVQTVAVRTFSAVDAEHIKKAKELIDSCETVLTVFDRTEWTKLPEGLKEILAYAEEKSKLTE